MILKIISSKHDLLIQRPRQRGAAPLQLRRCWLRVRYRYWPRVARFRGHKQDLSQSLHNLNMVPFKQAGH